MPAEAGGVELERHPARESQLADREPGSIGTRGLEPAPDLVRRCAAHRRVVEGMAAIGQHRPLTARHADEDVAGPVERAGFLLLHLERQQLTEARRAARVERHVPARLEVESVERGLVLEPAPVDRGGERQDRRF